MENPDASDGLSEVEASWEKSRTPRTGDSESNADSLDHSRTGRTGFQNSRVYAEKVPVEDHNSVATHKEFSGGVRSVRESEVMTNSPMELQEGVRGVRMPYLMPDGTLVIQFDSPERFHWWKGGQSVAETRAEVQRRQAALE